MGRYFIADNKYVDPFLSLGFAYGMGDLGGNEDLTSMNLSLMFGAQAELVKNVFIYTGVGLSYGSTDAGNDVTSSTMGLMTASVGAIFYFE